MPTVIAIPQSSQRVERWANGAGSTTVILREPDNDGWLVRASVAIVDREGLFSELPATRRTLVPLDAPMALHFPDGRELHGQRMHAMQFDGAPAPVGLLPEGPTRDFNLMLRGAARGEVLPRTLVDSMVLAPRAGESWLVYLDSGRAELQTQRGDSLELAPGDAARVIHAGESRVLLAGGGEIVLARLYA